MAAARRFAYTRGLDVAPTPMNRLYVVESNFTITGSMADHRLRMSPGGVIERFTRALMIELASRGASRAGAHRRSRATSAAGWSREGIDLEWLDAVADDLVDEPRPLACHSGRGATPAGARTGGRDQRARSATSEQDPRLWSRSSIRMTPRAAEHRRARQGRRRDRVADHAGRQPRLRRARGREVRRSSRPGRAHLDPPRSASQRDLASYAPGTHPSRTSSRPGVTNRPC